MTRVPAGAPRARRGGGGAAADPLLAHATARPCSGSCAITAPTRDHFLWHTHQFPDLARMVVADRAALAALRRLRGRKIVFSNAPAHYAHAVLDVLGIAIALRRGVRDRAHALPAEARSLAGVPAPAARGARRGAPRRHGRRQPAEPARRAASRHADGLGQRVPRAPGYVDAKVSSVRQLPRLLDDLAARLSELPIPWTGIR